MLRGLNAGSGGPAHGFQRGTSWLSRYIPPKNLASFYRVLRSWVRLIIKSQMNLLGGRILKIRVQLSIQVLSWLLSGVYSERENNTEEEKDMKIQKWGKVHE